MIPLSTDGDVLSVVQHLIVFGHAREATTKYDSCYSTTGTEIVCQQESRKQRKCGQRIPIPIRCLSSRCLFSMGKCERREFCVNHRPGNDPQHFGQHRLNSNSIGCHGRRYVVIVVVVVVVTEKQLPRPALAILIGGRNLHCQ